MPHTICWHTLAFDLLLSQATNNSIFLSLNNFVSYVFVVSAPFFGLHLFFSFLLFPCMQCAIHRIVHVHTYTYISPSSDPLSDERAQELIDKALESGSLKMRNVISVLTGLMGSGKTWLLSRLFHQIPPGLYTSTGIAEQSFRGLLHHIGNLSMETWQQFLPENILEFLAHHFRNELPSANISALAAQLTTHALLESADFPPLPTPSTSVVAPLPTLPLQPTPSSPPKPSSTSQSMVRLVKDPKNSPILSMLELIHMIDTGGQPEYMEMMPHLIHSCHLAVLVLNLMFGLDDYPPIQLHEKGIAYKRALPSQHTNRQVIQKLASTLQAKRFSCKKGQCFRLLVVATHKDCVKGDLAARLEAIEQVLNDILLPSCKGELIVFSANQIAFVLNLKDPDSDDIKSLQLLREKIGASEVGEIVEVPGSFLIFEQDLLKFAVQVERDILSIDECLQVGAKLKMNSEVVEAALIFFHRQITFLYFRNVLPHLVFTNPQVPVDFINAVVQFSYKVTSGVLKGYPANLTSSLRDGIITEEILGHKVLSKCFIPNLYEPQHAIEMLFHNFNIAPLSREPQLKEGTIQRKIQIPFKREKREYLMMSLVPAIPDNDLSQYIPRSSDIAPLLVKFTNDCVPLSCFSSTVSCLLSMYDWRLCRSEGGSPECLAHNVVSLYSPTLPVQIVLLDAANHVEIHIHAKKKIEQQLLPDICTEVRDTVLAAIRDVFDTMQLIGIGVTPAFPCPCSTVHSASVYKFRSKRFLRCSKTGASEGQAEGKHIIWLDIAEKDNPSRDKPSLHKPSLPPKPSGDKLSLPPKSSLHKPSLPPKPSLHKLSLPPKPSRDRLPLHKPSLPPKPSLHKLSLPPKPSRDRLPLHKPSLPPKPSRDKPSLPPKPSRDKPSQDKPSLPPKPSRDKPSQGKPSRDRPTLVNLLSLKIHERVGAKYKEFGIYLLNDETGCQVDALEMECLGKPDRIALKILQEWVKGKGVERSWVALIKTLRKCELSVLAEQVEKKKVRAPH